jgi:hypothetical protein
MVLYLHDVLDGWRNDFTRVLNTHEVCDVMKIQMHAADTLLREPGLGGDEIAIEKLRQVTINRQVLFKSCQKSTKPIESMASNSIPFLISSPKFLESKVAYSAVAGQIIAKG